MKHCPDCIMAHNLWESDMEDIDDLCKEIEGDGNE
jgi:hypothetical protein